MMSRVQDCCGGGSPMGRLRWDRPDDEDVAEQCADWEQYSTDMTFEFDGAELPPEQIQELAADDPYLAAAAEYYAPGIEATAPRQRPWLLGLIRAVVRKIAQAPEVRRKFDVRGDFEATTRL